MKKALTNLNLCDNIAVVTGAGRGIGRAIALMLGNAGAEVVVTARTESEIETVAGEISAAGGRARAIRVDISGEEDIKRLFKSVSDDFNRLDILINNAGIGKYGKLVDSDADDLDLMYSVNVRGTFLCCREAMRIMIPRASGYIINVSSVLGFRGYADQSGYTAMKHGVMGLTKSLAVEAQEHGIRVSAILPGGVDTEMVRRARPDLDPDILLQPDDVAQAAEYLLSLSPKAAVDQIYIRRQSGKPF